MIGVLAQCALAVAGHAGVGIIQRLQGKPVPIHAGTSLSNRYSIDSYTGLAEIKIHAGGAVGITLIANNGVNTGVSIPVAIVADTQDTFDCVRIGVKICTCSADILSGTGQTFLVAWHAGPIE